MVELTNKYDKLRVLLSKQYGGVTLEKIALPMYGMFKQNNDTWGWNRGC